MLNLGGSTSHHIPSSGIGRFRSAEEAQRFREALNVQRDVQAMADIFLSQDETVADLNLGRRGEVLLDATSMGPACGDPSLYASGSLSFDPETRQVYRFQAQAWNSWALLANHPISSDEVSLTRQGDTTTYRSPSGTVIVDGQGNYTWKKFHLSVPSATPNWLG